MALQPFSDLPAPNIPVPLHVRVWEITYFNIRNDKLLVILSIMIQWLLGRLSLFTWVSLAWQRILRRN